MTETIKTAGSDSLQAALNEVAAADKEHTSAQVSLRAAAQRLKAAKRKLAAVEAKQPARLLKSHKLSILSILGVAQGLDLQIFKEDRLSIEETDRLIEHCQRLVVDMLAPLMGDGAICHGGCRMHYQAKRASENCIVTLKGWVLPAFEPGPKRQLVNQLCGHCELPVWFVDALNSDTK